MSAVEVFAEHGYEGTTIAMLARHASVGQGTVYRYFTNKRDLFDNVFDYAAEQLFASVDTSSLLDEIDSLDRFVSVVERLGDDMFELLHESTSLLKLVLVEAVAVDDEMTRRVGGVQEIVMSLVGSALELGKDRGWVRREVDTELISVAMAALALPGVLRGLQGPGERHEERRYTSGVIRLLARGVEVRT